MPKKAGESIENFEVSSDAHLSRTTIPTVPPNYLSRKHLFPLIDSQAPNTTVVIAQSGFGKTSLVAEWAHNQKKRVIWLTITETDSLHEMSELMIQATRNVVPHFAPWFESEQPLRPVQVVSRWAEELSATGEEFIFVLDNLRKFNSQDVDIASKLVRQFPQSIAFVALRRQPLEEGYAAFMERGKVSTIGPNELKFTHAEIENLATLYGAGDNCELLDSVKAADGWPSVTSMLLDYIKKTEKPVDFEKLVATETDPLSALAAEMVKILEPQQRSMLVKLSIANEFDHELAEVILEKDYSYDEINRIAMAASYFSQTGNPHQTFSFSELMRQTLLKELRKDRDLKKSLHEKLVQHYENQNLPNFALEHAFLAGNLVKVGEIFPDAARIMQARGNGKELIRWSVFAGDSSDEGILRRDTVALTGHLSSLDFKSAQALADSMKFRAQGTVLETFINQIASGALAYIDISHYDLDGFLKNFAIAMQDPEGPLALGIDEQIGLYRLAAIRAYVLDDFDELEKIYETAKKLAHKSRLPNTQIFLESIKAMYLMQYGDTRRAFESASLAHHQSLQEGFVGIMGPLETLYVMARCQLEFARPREAIELFNQVKKLSEQWKNWTWYFLADGHFSRDYAVKGMVSEALAIIAEERELVKTLGNNQDLSTLVDLNEAYVRVQIKDIERLAVLVERVPQVTFIKQARLHVAEKTGKKALEAQVDKMEAKTLREKLFKHLIDAGQIVDQEALAIKELRKALDIGAEVGVREVFLRQKADIGNLIIKIAGETPTVYLEELARDMTERIRERNTNPGAFASSLTKRELEVLRHLATERPISAIAATLHISQNTMKTHLKNLYRKMEVEGRVGAVEKAKANFVL
jgi:ATP/maltotriose-dependent transcriptional regulator MalT